MKRSEVIAIIERKMCNCECHGPYMVMHCVPCCDFTYVKRADIPAYVDKKMEEVNRGKENRDINRYAERLHDLENVCWGCGYPWTLRNCSWQKVKGLLNRVPSCPRCGSRTIIHLPMLHK